MTLGLAKFGDSWEQGRGIQINLFAQKNVLDLYG